MEHEYLVMKLGNVRGVDFYSEHLKVIEKYGYVDLARAGQRVVNFSNLKEPYFYIKESKSSKGRVFRAYIGNHVSGEKRVPEYYENLSMHNASWVRLIKIEIVDKNKFLSEHTLKNGKEIKALDRGAIPLFYVIDAKQG